MFSRKASFKEKEVKNLVNVPKCSIPPWSCKFYQRILESQGKKGPVNLEKKFN